MSSCIAADVGGYGSGLVLFRLGDQNRWLRWFADAVFRACRTQLELVAEVERLGRAWTERLSSPRPARRRLRSNAVAWNVLELVPRHLVLTASAVAAELGIPVKSAGSALRALADAGVLVQNGTVAPLGVGRPSRLYTSPELFGLVGANPLRG
ncbi:MAG: hypothetical protein ACRDZ8_13885 [Acidimicrobiales bacterium]